MVDVGTGTGAIALAIADEHPGAVITATDISPDALALAGENAERLGLAVAFVETDLLDGLAGPFDLVVSNPPYVTEAEIEGLAARGSRLGAAGRARRRPYGRARGCGPRR